MNSQCIEEEAMRETGNPSEKIPVARHSVVSDRWQPRGLRHARLPCPSLSPGVSQTHVH